jgi:hypothetical protein
MRCGVNDTTDGGPLESRITTAYVQLALSSLQPDGMRSVALATFGHLDLRLVELVPPRPADEPLFWLELYDNDTGAVIDSCGCDELQEATEAAQQLILQAQSLTSTVPTTVRRTRQ